MLIEFPDIFHWKSETNSKWVDVKGNYLNQIKFYVMKKGKISSYFHQTFLYFLGGLQYMEKK